MSWSSWTDLWGTGAEPRIADTVFYADAAASALADLADDDSQYNTPLTVGTNSVYELTSARFLQNTERTIDVRFSATTSHAGVFWSYGGQRLALNAGGTVSVVVNGSQVLALDATSLFAAGSRDFLLTWAMQPNTANNGSGSTATISEVYIWCITTGGFVRGRIEHSTPTATSTTCVWWAQTGAGSNAWTGGRQAARFSLAYHTATESYEEMVSSSDAPTLAGEDRTHIVVPPVSTTIGNDGHYVGPIAALAAVAVQQNDLRLAGPLVNILANSRVTHRGDRVGDEPFTLVDPGQAGRYLYLHWMAYAPIPPGVNRVSGRVFVQQWRTTGSDDNLEISLLSMSQPGWTYRPPTSPFALESYRTSETRNAADGSGATAGAWVSFDNLRIARDNVGWSYFGLAFRVISPGGSGSTDDQLWTVKSLVVDPIFEAQDDGLPGFGGG